MSPGKTRPVLSSCDLRCEATCVSAAPFTFLNCSNNNTYRPEPLTTEKNAQVNAVTGTGINFSSALTVPMTGKGERW